VIVGVFLQLLGAGGVQRVGRHAAAVLGSFARERGEPVRIYALYDPPGRHPIEVGDEQFEVRGFGGKKPRLVLTVLALIPRVRIAYLGHPNLAPLGLMLKMRPSSRYVVETHGIDIWERLPLIRRIGVRRADFTLAASSYSARRIVDAQCLSARRVVLLPWAVDPGFGRNGVHRGQSATLARGPRLLTVARLTGPERYKGVDTVLAAMPQVLEQVPDAHYLVVGDGDDRPRLESIAAALGISRSVSFLGSLSEVALCECFRACDVFVMPSRAEDFGLVFLEAMAYAKPVIGGNHCGTPDVVRDGRNGFLVNYNDIPVLANRLTILLRDRDLRARMGADGLRRLEEFHAFDRFRDGLAELLARAL
jgi:glycosyltransferase involved in cell wall biosynthesis